MEHKIDFLKLPGRIGSAMTNNRNNFEVKLHILDVYSGHTCVFMVARGW